MYRYDTRWSLTSSFLSRVRRSLLWRLWTCFRERSSTDCYLQLGRRHNSCGGVSLTSLAVTDEQGVQAAKEPMSEQRFGWLRVSRFLVRSSLDWDLTGHAMRAPSSLVPADAGLA